MSSRITAVALLLTFAAACTTARTDKPCDGITDHRYSCRAVPELRPEPVRASRTK